MEPLTIDQAQTLLQVTLPALKNEHRLTKTVIEAVPLDKNDYRPDENSYSALDLAWHIAAAENMFLRVPAEGGFDFSRNKRPESIRNSADVARWYADEFAANFERLTRLTDEQLTKVVDFRGFVQLSAVLFLELGLRHSIHHRGQLTVYLRPMGAKVPSVYGESYDARQARVAAEAGS
ncbi:MAG: DinB family protein [Acidobacteriaceae bacterium]|nr:DinB family protein [Acidobacteriaceae bacterium]